MQPSKRKYLDLRIKFKYIGVQIIKTYFKHKNQTQSMLSTYFASSKTFDIFTYYINLYFHSIAVTQIEKELNCILYSCVFKVHS